MKLAIVQFSMAENVDQNLGRAGELVGEAARRGAELVLLPELFASRYFPRTTDKRGFALAEPSEQSRALHAMRLLARSAGVVLPVSYFERAGDRYFNSVAVF